MIRAIGVLGLRVSDMTARDLFAFGILMMHVEEFRRLKKIASYLNAAVTERMGGE